MFEGEFLESSQALYEKVNDIPKEHFELYLKECKWRFKNIGYQTC